MKKFVFILGIIVGFLVAAHWDFGRESVQNVSPIYGNKKVEKGLKEIGHGLKKAAEGVQDKGAE